MTGQEVEMDQHGHAGRQLSALLSAALAAAQSAAQVAADRARKQAQAATQEARDSERQVEQLSREQRLQVQQEQQRAAAAQREAERQARAEQSVRHRQWGLKPTSQWLHDNPLSAAAAWASADVHRGDDPVAARHAEQWEAIFKKENIDVEDVRSNAPAAVAAAEQTPASAQPGVDAGDVAGELIVAEVAGSAVLSGAVDVAHALEHEHAMATDGAQWTAYADGAPTAALGGRGVSTPPTQVLSAAREAPDLASTTAASRSWATELVTRTGLER
ncbi:hypothetical protein SAMN05892883_2239 [Jatrophihabitans sp. GAS493]|uniref:hypothetical protein n=1 Tax=Jatrophihabitans sp. GAS493 TaxID=1907575 RepID=UPI000BB7A4CE|nr:hypothetical protein [Jatrophihabitans sp. GAS493]SOD72925.1 hypothetical protein SAMN05892883_2239 [Jatrophihabitans sp. GAS493]